MSSLGYKNSPRTRQGQDQEETLKQMWDQRHAKPHPGTVTDTAYSLNICSGQALLGLHVLVTATNAPAPQAVSSSEVSLLFALCVWLLVASK